MADTREDDKTLSHLRSLAETLDYTEKSWIETKETLDKLKAWALVQENRYVTEYLILEKLFRAKLNFEPRIKNYFKSFEVFELLCHNFDQGNLVCGSYFIFHAAPSLSSEKRIPTWTQ